MFFEFLYIFIIIVFNLNDRVYTEHRIYFEFIYMNVFWFALYILYSLNYRLIGNQI